MRHVALGLLVLLAAPALAGCTLVADPKPKDVAGAVDGYDPTASHLKVHLVTDDGTVLVDFDRRDWNVKGIADLIDGRQVRSLSVHGMPRDILNEVLVETVASPSELSRMRWNDQTSPEERGAAEQAYDALVAQAHPIAGSVEAPATAPTLALPTV